MTVNLCFVISPCRVNEYAQKQVSGTHVFIALMFIAYDERHVYPVIKFLNHKQERSTCPIVAVGVVFSSGAYITDWNQRDFVFTEVELRHQAFLIPTSRVGTFTFLCQSVEIRSLCCLFSTFLFAKMKRKHCCPRFWP